MKESGVRRVSLGPRLFEAAFGRLRTVSQELLQEQSVEPLFTEAVTFAGMNQLLLVLSDQKR